MSDEMAKLRSEMIGTLESEKTVRAVDIDAAERRSGLNAEYMMATLIVLLIDKGVVAAEEVTSRYSALSNDFLHNAGAHPGAMAIERLLGLIRQEHSDGTKPS